MANVLDRAALVAKVGSLRRARGIAGLDGAKFDNAALVEAEAQLAALEDIDAERSRRLIEAALSADERRVASLRGEVGEHYQEFLKEGARAENALADLVAAIRGMKAAAAKTEKAANSIAAGTAPTEMSQASIEDRITRFICWQFAKLSGTSRFGLFELRSSVEPPTDFLTLEKRTTAAAVEAIVNPAPKVEPTAPVLQQIESMEFQAL